MRWFLGIVVGLLLALVLQSGLLAYAMYVLLGVLIISRLLARAWTGNIFVERTCDHTTSEIGELVRVRVTVENRGKLPVPWVLIEDMLPREAVATGNPRLRVKGKRLQLSMLRAGHETQLTYLIEPIYRGYYQIGPTVLESGDLFGLHRRYRIGAEPQYLVVYPSVVPLEGYDLASRRPIGEVRMTHRLYEDPTRIAGVRSYQAGDPLNRVHWRATARTGTLHSKVYEPSTLAGATLLLDFHEDGYPSRSEPFRSELAVTAAASLAHAVALLGQQIGLATNGRDAAERIRLEGWDHQDYRTRLAMHTDATATVTNERLTPVVVDTRRSMDQFHHIRDTLARVEQTDGLSLASLVVEVENRLPRDATVVALLPAVPSETAIALGSLRRQGYAVSVVLIALAEEALPECMGRLLAEGIQDVRHLKNEMELPALCRQATRQTTPYALV